MKKPHSHTKLSDVVCCMPDCGRYIKQNVVDRKGNKRFLRCYKCEQEHKDFGANYCQSTLT